jgi:hypothetical protein
VNLSRDGLVRPRRQVVGHLVAAIVSVVLFASCGTPEPTTASPAGSASPNDPFGITAAAWPLADAGGQALLESLPSELHGLQRGDVSVQSDEGGLFLEIRYREEGRDRVTVNLVPRHTGLTHAEALFMLAVGTGSACVDAAGSPTELVDVLGIFADPSASSDAKTAAMSRLAGDTSEFAWLACTWVRPGDAHATPKGYLLAWATPAAVYYIGADSAQARQEVAKLLVAGAGAAS